MNHLIVPVGCISAISFLLEIAFIVVIEGAFDKKISTNIRRRCQFLMGLSILTYLCLIGLFSWAALDMLSAGNIVGAIKLGISALIVVVGIYILVLRRFLKTVMKKRI